MRRKRSLFTIARDQELLSRIMPIKTDHPLWGYRRIWAYLKYRELYPCAINRVHRVMKKHDLLVTKQQRLRAKRCPIRPKPPASHPNQYWGIDITKIKFEVALGKWINDYNTDFPHQALKK